jgi:hypothetical protein
MTETQINEPKENKWLNLKSYSKLLIIILILGSTTLLYLFLAGWRPSFIFNETTPSFEVKQTGMISAKSDPQGANLYLDGKLITATNNTLSGIQPGKHKLRIVKNGYVDWEKEIEVFPELVTDITAVLITQTPRIEPLTNTGAKVPSLSYSLEKIAFFSKDTESPGVWVQDLNGSTLNIFRNSAKNILKDNNFVTYSNGKTLLWSPDEDQLLIELENSKFYLLDINSNNVTPISKPEELKEQWKTKIDKKRLDFIAQLELPEEIVKIASLDDTQWSPDNKKFLYKVKEDNKFIYKIYNMEKPLPIGEKIETTVFEYPADSEQPKISWYSDSFHLIMTEFYSENDKKGKISIIRIDGTNKIEIYNNTLFSDKVYSTPAGDKLIILTSFKSNGQSDLYTLGIK